MSTENLLSRFLSAQTTPQEEAILRERLASKPRTPERDLYLMMLQTAPPLTPTNEALLAVDETDTFESISERRLLKRKLRWTQRTTVAAVVVLVAIIGWITIPHCNRGTESEPRQINESSRWEVEEELAMCGIDVTLFCMDSRLDNERHKR